MKDHNLRSKGGKLEIIKENQVEQVMESIIRRVRETKEHKILKKIGLGRLLEFLTKFQLRDIIEATSKGENGFYFPALNRIYTGEKSSGILLHELGHMINANKSKALKTLIILSRGFPLMVVIASIFNFSAMTKVSRSFNNVSKQLNDTLEKANKPKIQVTKRTKS